MTLLDYSVHAVADILQPRGQRETALNYGDGLRYPFRKKDFGTVVTFRTLLQELVEDNLAGKIIADVYASSDGQTFEIKNRHACVSLVVTSHFGRYEAAIDLVSGSFASSASESGLHALDDAVDTDILSQMRHAFYCIVPISRNVVMCSGV